MRFEILSDGHLSICWERPAQRELERERGLSRNGTARTKKRRSPQAAPSINSRSQDQLPTEPETEVAPLSAAPKSVEAEAIAETIAGTQNAASPEKSPRCPLRLAPAVTDASMPEA